MPVPSRGRACAAPSALTGCPWREVGELEGLVRAKRRRKLPVVLTREEVKSVLAQLQGADYLDRKSVV